MKKIALIAAAVSILGQFATAGEITGSFADAKAESAKLGKPLLVDFFAEW
jgi:hypothetical protein